jgi:predicted RNase H-like nuclease (RuvC/YqgF family)
MSHNRVEKLESRVEELEASISGLTDELMETKSRLADLEDESTGEYIEAGVGPVAESDSQVEADKSAEGESEDTETPETDDIIVA